MLLHLCKYWNRFRFPAVTELPSPHKHHLVAELYAWLGWHGMRIIGEDSSKVFINHTLIAVGIWKVGEEKRRLVNSLNLIRKCPSYILSHPVSFLGPKKYCNFVLIVHFPSRAKSPACYLFLFIISDYTIDQGPIYLLMSCQRFEFRCVSYYELSLTMFYCTPTAETVFPRQVLRLWRLRLAGGLLGVLLSCAGGKWTTTTIRSTSYIIWPTSKQRLSTLLYLAGR